MFCEACQREINDGDWSGHTQGKKHQKKFEIWKAANCALYISNLKGCFSSAELHSYFSSFGEVDNLKLFSHNCSGIVTFTSKEATEQVLNQPCHQLGSRLLHIARSHTLSQAASQQNTDQPHEELEQLWLKINQLHNIEAQIDCLLTEWSLTPGRLKQIKTFVHSLEKAIQVVIPEASLQPFGSVVTGLGSVNCDLDVVLQFVQGQRNQQRQPFLPQKKFLRGLKVENGFISFESLQELPASKMCRVIMQILLRCNLRRYLTRFVPLTSARIPLLKFHYICADLDVDMTFHSSLSVRNTQLIHTLLQLDDRVRPLVFVLRFWIKFSGFCDNQATRITNYALFLLVYLYLENTEPRVLPSVEQLSRLAIDAGCPRTEMVGWDCTFSEDVDLIRKILLPQHNTQSVGELLGGFFNYYSKLDILCTVMCPRTGICYSILEFRKMAQNTEKLKTFKFRSLCLQDPFELSHNTLANVSQKNAHHFCRCLLETAETINCHPDKWTLATILPTHPVTLGDDVFPVRDPLALVVPFNPPDLPEMLWDCVSIEETKLKWHQWVLNMLLQCLDAWKITCKGITELVATGMSAELKRKGDDLKDNVIKRLMRDGDCRMTMAKACDAEHSETTQNSSNKYNDMATSETGAISFENASTQSGYADGSSKIVTSSLQSVTTSFEKKDVSSQKLTASTDAEQAVSSENPVNSSETLAANSLYNLATSSEDQSSSQENAVIFSGNEVMSSELQPTIGVEFISCGNVSSSVSNVVISSDKVILPPGNQTSSSNNHCKSSSNLLNLSDNIATCQQMSCLSSLSQGASVDNKSEITSAQLSAHYHLKRTIHQKTCIHCEATHKTWYGRKQVANCFKAGEPNISVVELERKITAKLCEESDLSAGDPLKFDVCLERVSFGQRTQIEISIEAEENNTEIIQFRCFLHGYGYKVLKSALSIT